MTNKKLYNILLTQEQDRMLKEKASASGFYHTSEYIRFMLFTEASLAEKVDAIYTKVVEND